MKCEALKLSDINLVQIEQDKKPVVVAKLRENGTYSFTNDTPSGKSHISKKTKPKCACAAKSMSGFVCPKLGTKKEGGQKIEQGSAWRATPVCHTIQKLM